jgi:hypothetical protein
VHIIRGKKFTKWGKGVKRTLQKSLDEKWCVRLTTSQPSGDAFDGVVIHIGKSIVALREFRDFQADGVLVFPKKSLAEVRDGELEVCENKIIKHSGEIRNINKMKWLADIDTVEDLLRVISKRKIWPAIEQIISDDSALFVGSIVEVKNKFFEIYCYDAAGQWEGAKNIDYKKVFRVEFKSRYLNYFNDYMKPSYEALQRAC